MKLAFDLGTRIVSAAWATTGSPDPLPLKDSSPFVENLLLWRGEKVTAIDDQARSQLAQIKSHEDGVYLDGYRPDFARHRLLYLTGQDEEDPDPRSTDQVRRATRLSDIALPVEQSGFGYDGLFYRHGLARAHGGLMRQLWQRLRRLDPVTIDRCEGLLIGCPLTFHEFARRRILHSLKEGLADELFPANEFYQRAIQKVAFVDEPLAVLASLDFLYGGRARAQIQAANPSTIMTIDVGAGFASAAVYQVQTGSDHLVTPGRMLGERTRTDCAGEAVDRVLLEIIRSNDADLDTYITSRWSEAAFRIPLMDNIRRVKMQLSDPAVGEVSVSVPDADYVPVSRDQFASRVAPLARKAGQAVAEALMDARVPVNELGAAVVVGGTSLLAEFQAAIVEHLPGVAMVAPDASQAADASLAVVKGLARWGDVVAPAASMTPTNRRIALYNCNWSPQEQFPPPSEQFVEMYDPRKPDEHKHKDFWWAFLKVPPGFAKLTVSLFESTSRENHLFTLYGIPVDNPEDATMPERYQVYVDVTGDRIYPRIWVWDIQARRFLAKAFDIAKQAEARIAQWIESEHAAFSYFDGDVFDGVRDQPLGWLPSVKKLAVGDMVRIGAGDRADANWTGVDPGSNRVPVRTVTRIQPRGASGGSLPQVRNWNLSEFEIVLDDDPPRNLQNVLVQHVPDGQHDAQLMLTYRERTLEPLAAVTEDTLANAMGTSPVSQRSSSQSDRLSRAPRLAADDPFSGAGSFDPQPATAQPVSDGGTDAIPLDAMPLGTDPSSGSWTSGHATWAEGDAMMSDASAMPDSWSDSSAGTATPPQMSASDLGIASLQPADMTGSNGDLPAIMRELREQGIPTSKAEARTVLERLLQAVIDGRVPAPMAAAAATIIRAHFDLAD